MDSPALFPHEFGHFISSMYGDFDNSCSVGLNEADSVEEAVSDAYAMVVLSKQANWRYGHAARYPRDGKHTSVRGTDAGNQIYPMWSGRCDVGPGSPPDGIYDFLEPFTDAFAEVLNNVDCSSTACSVVSCAWGSCTTGYTTEGNDIGWASIGQARVQLSRSLAWATKVAGPSTTFPAFVQEMFNYLKFHAGLRTVGDNFRSVMAHHGIVFQ